MSTFQPRKATTIMQDAEKALELAKVSVNCLHIFVMFMVK